MPTATIVLKGTRHYGASLAERSGALRPGAPVELVPEPDNPHDRDAVMVRLRAGNAELGYVSREAAPKYRQLVLAGAVDRAVVKEAGWRQWADGTPRLRIALTIAYRDLGTHSSPSQGGQPRSGGEDLPAAPGVYAIVNDAERRKYIGSSGDVRARVKQHFRDLAQGRHPNGLLQRDYDAQGGLDFRPVVLRMLQAHESAASAEEGAIDAALERRQRLYNMTEDGQGNAAARYRAHAGARDLQSVSDRARSSSAPRRSHVWTPPPASPAMPAATPARVPAAPNGPDTLWAWVARLFGF